MRKAISIWGLFALVLCIAAPVVAQPLADRVPDDAIFYVGWQGTDAMGKAYEQSHLNGIIKDANLSLVVERFLTLVTESAEQNEVGSGKVFTLLQQLGERGWQRPWAFYFGGSDFVGEHPSARIALLIDAGDEAEALTLQLTQKLALPQSPQAPASPESSVGVLRFGSLVVISTRNMAKDAPKLTALLSGNVDKSVTTLKDDAAFAGSLKKLPTDSVAVAYLNVGLLSEMLNQSMLKGGHDDASKFWPLYSEAIGLAGLKHVIWGGRFVDENWQSVTYLQAPSPRHGVLKLLDSKPIDRDLWRLVPADVSWASAMRLDVSELYDELHASYEKILPGTSAEAKQYLAISGGVLGLDLEKHLIRALGPQWIVYRDENVKTEMGMGFTLVNELRDAESFNALLMQVERTARADAPDESPVKIVKVDGLDIYSGAASDFLPGWTMHEGRFYLSLTTAGAAAAAKRGASEKGSILENEKFAAMMKLRGEDKHPGQVAFVDLQKALPQTYSMMTTMMNMAAPGPDEAAQLAAIVPPLEALMPHVGPASIVSWSDETGIYMQSDGPFPGAAHLSFNINPQIMLLLTGYYASNLVISVADYAEMRAALDAEAGEE